MMSRMLCLALLALAACGGRTTTQEPTPQHDPEPDASVLCICGGDSGIACHGDFAYQPCISPGNPCPTICSEDRGCINVCTGAQKCTGPNDCP